MMRVRILQLVLPLMLLSCNAGEKKPSGLIPEEKMKLLLWDILRGDQFMNDFVFSHDSSLNKMNETVKLYRQIFKNHQVTREQFRESFTYYQEHPGLLKPLLDSVSAVVPAKPVADPSVNPQSQPPVPSVPQSTADSTLPRPAKKIRDLKAV